MVGDGDLLELIGKAGEGGGLGFAGDNFEVAGIEGPAVRIDLRPLVKLKSRRELAAFVAVAVKRAMVRGSMALRN